MLKQTLWASNVAPNLKELPIPLTGHCAIMINNNLGLLLGGGTNTLDKTGAVDHTSEVNGISWNKILNNQGRHSNTVSPLKLGSLNKTFTHAFTTHHDNNNIVCMPSPNTEF